MKVSSNLLWTSTIAAALVIFCVGGLVAATIPHYVITNNDNSQGNAAGFYTISGGSLTPAALVKTGGTGIDGIGSVATKRVSVLRNSTQSCVFISDAGTNDVAGISVTSLTLAGRFKGSSSDNGMAAGIGVVNNGTYLYASFTTSKTIAAFQIMSGCTLTFLQDVAASGLSGAAMIDMAAHGNFLVVSFGDGSIESFNIASGVPVPNGDLQETTGHKQNNSTPQGTDLTADDHYALFSGGVNGPEVEVSDLSSGKLAPTVVYNLGSGSAVASLWLSPDQSLVYLGEFSAQQVAAAFFDKTTGVVSVGCASGPLKGNLDIAGITTQLPTGTGGVLYVAEIEVDIGIVRITSSGGTCSFAESPKSPIIDHNTITLESIGVFPPRPF